MKEIDFFYKFVNNYLHYFVLLKIVIKEEFGEVCEQNENEVQVPKNITKS